MILFSDISPPSAYSAHCSFPCCQLLSVVILILLFVFVYEYLGGLGWTKDSNFFNAHPFFMILGQKRRHTGEGKGRTGKGTKKRGKEKETEERER